MNKKGSAIFVYLMVGVLFFILGLALAPALTQTTGEAQTDLNCSSATISNQDKAVCYQMDSLTPFFTAILFGLGGLVLTKIIL